LLEKLNLISILSIALLKIFKNAKTYSFNKSDEFRHLNGEFTNEMINDFDFSQGNMCELYSNDFKLSDENSMLFHATIKFIFS
jgi:pyruvate formate-lyase activating enzyme-like uncharacterized protein